jgi:hypothetical protein
VAALLSAFVEAGENRKSEKTQAEYRRIVAAEIGVGSLHWTICATGSSRKVRK